MGTKKSAVEYLEAVNKFVAENQKEGPKNMTAVEWLLERYKSQNTLLFSDDFELAKKMERQQIIDVLKK